MATSLRNFQAFGLGGRAPGAMAVGSKAPLKEFCACGLEVVHLLAASLRVERSLPGAVRYAARYASAPAAEELRKLEWEVRIRHFATMDEAFTALARRVGEVDGELCRALLTLQRAEGEPTREGLERRLDRAYDIVASAESRRRELLQNTLERPVSLLFGAGVVLPLLLSALAPMLQFSGSTIGPLSLALILLVVVPAATYLGGERIVSKNRLARPLGESQWPLVLVCAAGPAAAAAVGWGAGLAFRAAGALPSTLLMVVPASASAVACGLGLLRRLHRDERDATEMEAQLADVLHTIGGHLTAGRPAEQALLEAVGASGQGALTKKLRVVLFDVFVGRRSLEDAVESDEDVGASPRAVAALRLLAGAARRNHIEAGRIVTHLAEFERVHQDALAATRTKIRGVVDTARTSMVLFAPLIVGITAGMYGMFAKLTAGAYGRPALGAAVGDASSFAPLMVLYLCAEVVLVDWFAARMASATPLGTFAKSLARDVPAALFLFAAALAAASALF